jgi:hypothetical protein
MCADVKGKQDLIFLACLHEEPQCSQCPETSLWLSAHDPLDTGDWRVD